MIHSYHFLRADMTAGRGAEPPWRVGDERTIPGEIALCRRGYHSAVSWYEALRRAPGPVACVVEVSAPVEVRDGEQVSHTRRLVAARNVERELRLYACECAERVLPIYERERPSDTRPRRAIEVARAYVRGEASAEDLAAALDAARDAAWAAARAAARDAALAAALAAARDAAWAAARAAALDAARDAAWAAALDAEVRWQAERLAAILDARLVVEVREE